MKKTTGARQRKKAKHTCRYGKHTRTDIHTKDIIALYESGLSTGKVAAQLGCGKETVRSRLIEAGVILRPDVLHRPRALRTTPYVRPERLAKREAKQALIAEIIQLDKEGVSRKEIKRRTGKSIGFIRKHCGKKSPVPPAYPFPLPPGVNRCSQCTRPAAPNHKTCQYHLDADKRRHAKRTPEQKRAKRLRAFANLAKQSWKLVSYLFLPDGKNNETLNHVLGFIARDVVADYFPEFDTDKGMVCHHVDRNRFNNDIRNLQVYWSADHGRLHAIEEKNASLRRKRLYRLIKTDGLPIPLFDGTKVTPKPYPQLPLDPNLVRTFFVGVLSKEEIEAILARLRERGLVRKE